MPACCAKRSHSKRKVFAVFFVKTLRFKQIKMRMMGCYILHFDLFSRHYIKLPENLSLHIYKQALLHHRLLHGTKLCRRIYADC